MSIQKLEAESRDSVRRFNPCCEGSKDIEKLINPQPATPPAKVIGTSSPPPKLSPGNPARPIASTGRLNANNWDGTQCKLSAANGTALGLSFDYKSLSKLLHDHWIAGQHARNDY